MNPRRVWLVLRKDLALGPRSPIFLWAIALPVVLTVVFQFAFGSLFESEPRLAIVDDGDSAITAGALALDGVAVTVLEDADVLRRGVEANDYDAGLVLPAGFDEAVRSGEHPLLDMVVGGQSYASDRVVLSVLAVDLVRQVEGSAPTVDVELVETGTTALPWSLRLLPVLMMYALFIAGVFVPASSIVDERVAGTLTALLVTPARLREILAAKAGLGVVLAFTMAVVTLAINGAVGARVADLLLVVAVGAVFCSTLGLLIGSLAKNGAALFTVIKGSGAVLFTPVIFYLFPDWPQWIAHLFPTYWMIDPIWRVAVLGDGVADVWPQLIVAAAITGVVLAGVAALSRRLRAQLAGG